MGRERDIRELRVRLPVQCFALPGTARTVTEK